LDIDFLTESEIESVRALGYGAVPEALAATGLAVDRGHHVAIIAAEGSGHLALFGYAIGRKCDPAAPGPQALVLTATREGAVRAGRAASRFVANAGITVEVMPGAEQLLADVSWPHVVVGRPTRILAAVRSGHLGLGAVRLLVIDGSAALRALDEWSSVEALLDGLGKDAQKIAVTDEWDDEFAGLLTRQLPRARRWPKELFESATAGTGADGGQITIGVAGTSHEALDLVSEAVGRARTAGADSIFVRCENEDTTTLVEDHLAAHGLTSREGSGAITVTTVTADSGAAGAVIALGLPAGLSDLESTFSAGSDRYLIVSALEAKQAGLLAKRAGWPIATITVPAADGALDNVSRFRSRVRSQLVRHDESADLLLLEPLLEEFGAARVAAALSALLRQHGESNLPVRPWADVEASSVQGPAPVESQTPRGVRKAWSRVYVGAGKRDDIRPGDLVGAITGETSAVGGQIGKIEIRGSFALVDIDSQIVDDVISALDGTTIKGRQVAVRLDREN
jgi:ATP-dependent RNA helicase DeaD